MNDALKDLNKVLETSPTDKVAVADRECLNALKIASGGKGYTAPTTTQEERDNEDEERYEKAGELGPISPLEKSVYEKATVILTKLVSYENNEHLAKIAHDSSI